MKKRNPAIELWRCLCMFGVVLGHVLDYNEILPRSLFLWHIPGFLAISGYFGIRFSLKKCIKLGLIVYSCYWLTIPFRDSESLKSLLLPHGGWFFPFYLTLVLTSMIWNAAVEREENDGKIMVVCLLLFAVRTLYLIFGNSVGMMAIAVANEEFGLLLMLGVYMLARICHRRQIAALMSSSIWGMCFAASIMLSYWCCKFFPKLTSYTQMISVASGFCGLFCFTGLPKFPKWAEKIICYISPSMFSVYILHECCVKQFSFANFDSPSFGWAIGRASIIFITCIIVDLIRRAIFYAVEKSMETLRSRR